MPRYHIVIDEDPSDSDFIAELGSDRIRAIAWQEHAGGCTYGIHHHTYPQYNHYWQDSTRTPCENGAINGYDTGIMQIVRVGIGWPGWEPHFESDKSDPPGYTQAKWDSLAWSWKICIANGKYIYDTHDTSFYTDEQTGFEDSCKYSDCGSFPGKPNKEDLKAYGYHSGTRAMRSITASNWNIIICDTSATPREDAVYVQNVRSFFYAKPW